MSAPTGRDPYQGPDPDGDVPADEAEPGWRMDLELDLDAPDPDTLDRGARGRATRGSAGGWPGPVRGTAWSGGAGAGLGASPVGAAGPGTVAPPRIWRWIAAGLAATLVGFFLVRPPAEPEPRRPAVTVLGRDLPADVVLRLPPGAVTTADESYVGVRFASGDTLFVTVPTQVADPSGTRSPLPPEPASWLRGNPSVFVSRVRTVDVGGTAAVQLDYRRSRAALPDSRFARLPLFCGWKSADAAGPVAGHAGPDACTQITSAARVRATFVPVGGRTVLVEAVWRPDVETSPIGTASAGPLPGRMPRDLQQSYDALVAGLIR